MNSVAIERAGARDGAAAWTALPVRAWRRLDRRHGSYAALVAAAIGAIHGVGLMQLPSGPSAQTVLLLVVAVPAATTALVLLGWALADAAHGTRLPRSGRIAFGFVVSTALAAALSVALHQQSDLAAFVAAELQRKGRAPPPLALKLAADWMAMLLNFGLFLIAGELYLRRERLTQAAERALREQAQTARQVLESRLAAMQAQVEPRFLFDSLVDVQALYDREPGAGAQTLDRLITYLRVALPRLREAGSTVEAEVELVSAYLSVVAARAQGRPTFRATVDPGVAAARFYPMLLLPLVQRAVRRGEGTDESSLPQAIELAATRRGDRIAIVLRLDRPGLCASDGEYERVRQRLDGLYAGAATLACGEEGGRTRFELTIPASDADRDRR